MLLYHHGLTQVLLARSHRCLEMAHRLSCDFLQSTFPRPTTNVLASMPYHCGMHLFQPAVGQAAAMRTFLDTGCCGNNRHAFVSTSPATYSVQRLDGSGQPGMSLHAGTARCDLPLRCLHSAPTPQCLSSMASSPGRYHHAAAWHQIHADARERRFRRESLSLLV